jgi:hypothetical protein
MRLAVTDQRDRRWTVLHTAEAAYLQIMGELHPGITRAHARDEWQELVNRVHRVKPTRDPRLEIWQAGSDFDRVRLIVEPVAGGFRVCEVQAAHVGLEVARARVEKRAAERAARALPKPGPAPPLPAPRRAPAPREERRQLERRQPSPWAGRAVPRAVPDPTPPPERRVPKVELAVLAMVERESKKGPFPGAVAIARRLHLDVEVVRDALVVLESWLPPDAPARKPSWAPPWRRKALERSLATVEVEVVRRRSVSR